MWRTQKKKLIILKKNRVKLWHWYHVAKEQETLLSVAPQFVSPAFTGNLIRKPNDPDRKFTLSPFKKLPKTFDTNNSIEGDNDDAVCSVSHFFYVFISW